MQNERFLLRVYWRFTEAKRRFFRRRKEVSEDHDYSWHVRTVLLSRRKKKKNKAEEVVEVVERVEEKEQEKDTRTAAEKAYAAVQAKRVSSSITE